MQTYLIWDKTASRAFIGGADNPKQTTQYLRTEFYPQQEDCNLNLALTASSEDLHPSYLYDLYQHFPGIKEADGIETFIKAVTKLAEFNGVEVCVY